jgi:uncharacterized caspase-like protein
MFRYLIVFLCFIAIGALFYLKMGPQQVAETKGIPSSGPVAPPLKASGPYTARIALVMGIGEYHNAFVGKYQFDNLSNPVNDAEDMAAVLRNLGFDVILKRNLKNRAAMKKAVLEFRQRLPENGAVGVFYFSGHGFQYNNVNYLMPVQAAMPTAIDIESEVLRTDYVLKHLEQVNQQGVNIIILDACRDSIPTDFFDDRENKGLFDNDLKAGFTNMQAPQGSLIAYSTGPNTTSWGGLPNERNSVYTKYLLQALQNKPHINVTQLLMSVRDNVLKETQRTGVQQLPWDSVSLTKPFCFKSCVSEPDAQLQQKLAEFEKKQAYLAQQQLEFEQQRQAELEKQRQRQAELEKQRQAELEKQRQAELEKQRQAELEKQRQAELKHQQETLEKQRAEFERQQAELKRQRAQLERDKARQKEEAKLAELARSKAEVSSSNRYTDNGDGSVTDNRSGLIWLKNANCFGGQTWETAMQSAANLASGQCGLRDGSQQGMWRLPTKREWETMIDKKYADYENYSQPALSNTAGTGPWKEGDAFLGVVTSDYWSSTTGSWTKAWLGTLSHGFVAKEDKTFPLFVWPVRGGQ